MINDKHFNRLRHPQPFDGGASGERGWLLPAFVLFAVGCGGALLWWLLTDDTPAGVGNYRYIYLLPWIALCAAVVLTPSAILFYQKKFDPFHPLVFAAWIFFIPAFVFGGLFLATGTVKSGIIHLIDQPEYNLPLTFAYVALGFAGLSVGFAVPWARRAGAWLAAGRLPAWNWQPSEIVAPSFVLLGIGLFFYVSAWIAGSVGYQQIDLNDNLSSLNFFFSLLSLEGSLLLWLFIFKSKQFTPNHLLALGVIAAAVLPRVVLGGNRSSLVAVVILVAMAYVYSGRQLKLKQGVIFSVIGVVALLVGMLYGTTFRQMRGSEAKTSMADYIGQAEQTAVAVTTQDPTQALGDSFGMLAQRLETATSLAVVVSNYEKLAPYEAAYGLENNIWTYTWTAFIPRFVWADKPVVSDVRAYSDLYFNFGENSFAITPMGDLLRNYGPVGIPLGMLLLGFLLRIVYAALIENQVPTIGRVAAYFMIMTSFSYEGFYGAILPSMIRVAFIVIISLAFVNLLTRRLNRV